MSECHLSLLFCGPRCCCSGFTTRGSAASPPAWVCCGDDGRLQLLCPSHTEPSLPNGRCSSSLCSVLQTSQQSLLSDHVISHLSATSRHCGLSSVSHVAEENPGVFTGVRSQGAYLSKEQGILKRSATCSIRRERAGTVWRK